MAGEWGTREEFLHPRDSHGRFRKSWKMAESVIQKISDLLERFNPKTFPDQENANNYVRSIAQSDRFLTNRHAAVDRFLRGFSKVNADLRAGKPNADADAMDKAMRPLPDDLILSRVVGPEAFGLDASNVSQLEEYTGKLVADKGFSSTNVGPPHRRQGGITMVIATPAGTKALAPSVGKPTSEVILDRDQPFRITKVSPDGTGGFYVMAVATPKEGAPKAGTLGTKAPVPNAQEVNQPPAIPGEAPQAPQAPVQPQSPQAPAAPQAAPVRTGKPGRPAGPPPPPRTEPVHAESIGGNAPATPQTPKTQRPAPNAPEVPPAPQAPTPEQVTPEAPLPPDRREEFRDAFRKADIPVPGQGPRRATYNKAYLDLSLRKGDPAEIAHRLDDEIALNDATIKSDRLDGTDSGPLPEDNRRLKLFSQFLKDHFGLEGAKKKEEGSPAPKKETPGSVPPTPKVRERTTPVPSKEEQQRMLNEPRKRVQGPRQPGKAIPSNDFLKPGDKVYRSNGDVKTIKSVGRAGEVTYTDGTTSRDRHRLHEDSIAGAQDRFQAKKGASKRISPEERAARTESRQQTRTGPAPERKVQENVPLAEPSDAAKGIRDRWLEDAGVNYDGLSDLEKVGVNLMAEQVASKKITRIEAQRRLSQSSSPNLNKVSGSVKTKKLTAQENAMREVEKIRAQGRDIAKRDGLEPPKTDQEAAKLVMGERAPKPVPAPARPEIPAKDLSDKGLMQRFDAEIKKDNPNEKRLKELGDELDRRDLESNEQIKRMSDDDLEKTFQDEIRKDNLDQVKVDRLGAELDRRDHERAQNERKIDALVAKGRSYQDAYAEVHGLDPAKMDAEERQASVDAQRRPGESREATVRRLYEDDLRRQYLDAERVTRGHLLTPEGRSKGIDPKELFQGSSIRSNKWASDELKEYWNTHPRKTYTQFKADLLNRSVDVAAAKKTQGIQKDLDLGMKIERRPRKTIQAPSEIEQAYRKTTIAQLRQQAQDNNIEVPKNLRLKQDIFDHVTKELAKREQSRRTEAPKVEASTPKPEAPKAEVPKPERLTPHMAVGKTNASRVPIGERVLVKQGPDGVWRPSPTKTGATPITVTGKHATSSGGVSRSRGGYQIIGEDDNGNRIEVRPGPGIQTYWVAPEKGATVAKKAPAPKKVVTPDKATTTKAEAPATDIDKMTVAQLKEEARRRNKRIPATITRKADIVEILKGDENRAQSEAIRKGAGGGLTSTQKVLEGSGLSFHDLSPAEQRILEDRSAAMLRQHDPAARADIIRPAEDEQDKFPGLHKLAEKIYPLSSAKEGALKPAPQKVAPKPPTLPGAPERYADIGTRLKAAGSREDAQKILSDEKLTVPQLRALADSLNIAVRGNKNDILKDLVHWTVGRRLDSAAVSRPSDTGKELRDITGARAPGDLKISTKPILPNRWGTTSGEINFHADGHLGRALATLGKEGLLEVPGEDDNVTNVIGKLATDAVRGKITQNQLIDKVRAVRDKMSASPAVRVALDRAIKQMEVPEVKIPDLPDGTPTPISKLMKGLATVPLARSDRIGHTDSSELRRLADIMDQWSKGRITPLGLIAELRSKILNQRHESEEGKFQIDDLVVEAMKELEHLSRTNRKVLYPPISRS